MNSKKAQAWGFDLMIAAIIFASGIIIFFIYSLNYPTEGQDTLDILSYEGNFIAENLLSPGLPENWNENNVVNIGIISNNKVNETKLEILYNMSKPSNPQGYAKAKNVFNTKYEYFFNFSKPITFGGQPIAEQGIGLPFDNQDPQNLIKITRFTIYKDEPVTLNIFIWE